MKLCVGREITLLNFRNAFGSPCQIIIEMREWCYFLDFLYSTIASVFCQLAVFLAISSIPCPLENIRTNTSLILSDSIMENKISFGAYAIKCRNGACSHPEDFHIITSPITTSAFYVEKIPALLRSDSHMGKRGGGWKNPKAPFLFSRYTFSCNFKLFLL